MVALARFPGDRTLQEGNTLNLCRRLDTRSLQNHRGDVMVLHELVTGGPGVLRPREPYHQGNVEHLRHRRVRSLPHEQPRGDPVTHAMTVVGGEYHHGIIKPSHRLESIHQEAEPPVTHGDITEVVRPGAGDELRVDVRDVPVDGKDVLPSLPFHVQLAVLLRSEPVGQR